MMADRLLGLALLTLGLGACWAAMTLVVPFAADPLGPSAFPATVSLLLAVCGLAMILWPENGVVMPEKLAAPPLLVAVMVVYALLLVPLGFMPATALLAFAVAVLFGARVAPAAAVGLITAVSLWLLFDKLLDLPLPRGFLPL